MKVFFIKLSEFLRYIDKSTFELRYRSDKRNIESQTGRFFVKYIASRVYGVENLEIAECEGKPYFLNSDLQFSISHSCDVLGIAFSENTIGFDVEKIKPRNLGRLSDYFKREFNDLDEFYGYWTLYEAGFKSKLQDGHFVTFRHEGYFCAISAKSCVSDLKLYEYSFDGANEEFLPLDIDSVESMLMPKLKELELESETLVMKCKNFADLDLQDFKKK